VPSGPTAPTNLLGVVNGSTVGLSWRNTFGGGAPTNVMLDVTGGLTTSMAIGLSESFTFAGVPPGTYTFSVRGINSGGTSGSSNSVTLTFPSACNGSTPSTPSNFVAARAGNVLTVSWLPSTSGRASTSYQVNVTGSFSTTVTTTARSVSSPVGPGTYNFRVRAVNACGNSSYTAFQTLTVP
jgi:predicted phage tail protein